MTEHDQDFDPWSLEVLQQSSASEGETFLSIETIENVEPLDMQMGVWPPKTVPDVLYEPLFGQPEPTETEIASAGGKLEDVPPMQTYTILDAAKVFGLAEILDASGLEHRCLFKGEAYDELKDVAPWIVRLEERNDFTGKLFTAGKPPWCIWDEEPGIYVRSRGSLDDMWRHFRKFTRVQDENGKWFYFRFWEPRVAVDYFTIIRTKYGKLKYWFGGLVSGIIVPQAHLGTITKISLTDNGQPLVPFKFLFEDDERIGLTNERIQAFRKKLSVHCAAQVEYFSALPNEKKVRTIDNIMTLAKRAELRSEKAIANYVEASLRHGEPLERTKEFKDILSRPWKTEIERTEELVKRVKEQHG